MGKPGRSGSARLETRDPRLKEVLTMLYSESKLTVPEIGKQLGINRSTLYSFFIRNNIPRRRKGNFGERNPSWKGASLTKERLEPLVARGLSVHRIAKLLGTNFKTVQHHLVRQYRFLNL